MKIFKCSENEIKYYVLEYEGLIAQIRVCSRIDDFVVVLLLE
jgi:ribosomal protein S27AE